MTNRQLMALDLMKMAVSLLATPDSPPVAAPSHVRTYQEDARTVVRKFFESSPGPWQIQDLSNATGLKRSTTSWACVELYRSHYLRRVKVGVYAKRS